MSSQELADRFIKMILGDEDNRRITKVETQVIYDDCRPDMKITLNDGFIILCENKINADETVGNENTNGMLQLGRYLQLPVNGLIYIRCELKTPSEGVLNHSKYLKPTSGPHYLWRDFYSILAEDSNPLVKCVAKGFEDMGFVPPNPSIGDLTRNTPKKQRENFAKFWFPLSVRVRELGWKVQTGDVVERYLYHSTAELSQEIYVNPVDPTRFLIRYTPVENKEEALLEKINSITHSFNQNVIVRNVIRKAGAVRVIDVDTPINNVLPDSLSTSDEIEQALMDYVFPYITIAMGTYHDDQI